ncbi:DUF2332 domain-containing protein [Sphingomicrobium sp. XHP0239]|uniref:DUF2332 domain-containing protein n=1 Tax=Sphingomicrobium maritimum TaxID=3133972 RepID=UPI0031CC7362
MSPTPAAAFANQIDYCRANGAPLTAAIVKAVWDRVDPDGTLGQALHRWPGDPLADVLPLRVAAAVHALHLSGAEPRLAPLYAGELTREELSDTIAAVVAEREADILPWLKGPPQTNEAGRSAGFMAALLWLAARGHSPRFELIEIGSSAGINLMMDRFAFDLGGVRAGDAGSSLEIVPDWRGASPPDADVSIVSLTGCDRDPVDLSSREGRVRLAAYVWPEMKARMARLEQAFALADADPPHVVQADAADFVESRLAEPQEEGVTRVLMHSLVWQYLPAETQDRVRAAMEAAGARASEERPLAWVELEGDRTLLKHRLHVRAWPGAAERVELARAHAHGAWMEWIA